MLRYDVTVLLVFNLLLASRLSVCGALSTEDFLHKPHKYELLTAFN